MSASLARTATNPALVSTSFPQIQSAFHLVSCAAMVALRMQHNGVAVAVKFQKFCLLLCAFAYWPGDLRKSVARFCAHLFISRAICAQVLPAFVRICLLALRI